MHTKEIRQIFTLLFFLLSIATARVHAQTNQANRSDLFLPQIVVETNSPIVNNSTIFQNGDGNRAVSNQTSSSDQVPLSNLDQSEFQNINQGDFRFFNQGNPSTRNIAFMVQQGNQNLGDLSQSGTGLASIIIQSGSNNASNISLIGQNINLGVFQSGDRNDVNTVIQNEGVGSKNALMSQFGDQNSIEFSLVNSSSMRNQPIIINQFGSGLELKSNLDGRTSPITVNQYEGFGGAGMKVNISNTSFPVNVR